MWTIQSFEAKEGQRVIHSMGNSPMGYALPASIGASFALPGRQVICIAGDGGLQLNIQELQTLKGYALPVKIFVMNNRSMGIIKQFQDLYFDSRYYASSAKGGYTAPDFVKIAKGYGIAAFAIKKTSDMKKGIEKALKHSGPVLCEVYVDVNQKLNPKLEFGRPIEDMSPYLPREEFLENMRHTPPLPESKEIPKKTVWRNA